ncbi:hypothetical protein D3C78_1544120 [compost metagenome]
MSIKLEAIQKEVYRLGEMIGAPRALLLLRDLPADDGAPYVVISNEILCYISSERGYEIFRKAASSLDELLYFILDRVTSRMAMDYELNNRVEGQDSRRIYFSKKIELMNELCPQWGCKARQEIERVLVSAPYVDG